MGRVVAEANGRVLDEARFPGRQGRLFFAYLVAARGRPVPRDELADAIWGESPPATWEKALTVIASKLRGLVAEDGITLTNAFGCYRLDLPEGTWVDLFAAESGAQDAEEALAAGELDQARAAAESAESLARRPFLAGGDGTWVERERRDLAAIRERALSVLADACLRSGAAREAGKAAGLPQGTQEPDDQEHVAEEIHSGPLHAAPPTVNLLRVTVLSLCTFQALL